jgi:hypothetical protein
VKFVPVISQEGKPLMPTIPSRARRSRKAGKATPFWSKGIFCVRLNVAPSDARLQPIAVGIDPGSRKEGLTVKSAAHTYLNIQADAVTHVEAASKTKRELRRGRRCRKTPCRANRPNRARGGIPPSTKARWDWKLRLCKWLVKIFPVEVFVVEDIKARTQGKPKWDSSFSPLEVGKAWFYEQLRKLAVVELRSGWQTKLLRDEHCLKKIGHQTAEVFEAHCVDSFVLAADVVGGCLPDNKSLALLTPLRFHRRQLHRLQPERGGARKPYGGTHSHGFKRGTLVKHPKYDVVYVGGCLNDRISLHSFADGKRLTQKAKPSDCRFISYASWRLREQKGAAHSSSA